MYLFQNMLRYSDSDQNIRVKVIHVIVVKKEFYSTDK